MRVSAISVHGTAGWPGVGLETHSNGLTAICGPSNSGKSTIAGLMGHALFGKSEAWTAGMTLPEGELTVEGHGERYRLRRTRDAQGVARLTVAAIDAAATAPPSDSQRTLQQIMRRAGTSSAPAPRRWHPVCRQQPGTPIRLTLQFFIHVWLALMAQAALQVALFRNVYNRFLCGILLIAAASGVYFNYNPEKASQPAGGCQHHS